jgi:assimilatory nitrate reductase catalytic subunit
VPLPGGTAYAWNAIEGGYAARFATNKPFADLFEALSSGSRSAERGSYNDPATGIFRAALILRGRLDCGALFWARERSAALELS